MNPLFSHALWIARQLDQEITTLGSQKVTFQTLEQRIGAAFREQFPDCNWSPQYLSECLQRRKNAQKALKEIPQAILKNGTLDLNLLIKEQLRKNPCLSTGSWQDPFLGKTDQQKDRKYFCKQISQIGVNLNGVKWPLEDIERRILSVQRHLLHRSAPLFTQRIDEPDDALEVILQTLVLTDPPFSDSIESFRDILLDQCLDIQRAAKEATYDALYLEVWKQSGELTGYQSDQLWPDLLFSENFIHELLVNCAKPPLNLHEIIDSVTALIHHAQQLPEELTDEELLQDNPPPVIAAYRSMTNEAGLDNGLTVHLYRTSVQLKNVEDPLLEDQIRSFAIFDKSFKDQFFPTAPPIAKMIQTWLEKRFVELPSPFFVDHGHVVLEYIYEMADFARSSPLFLEENRAQLLSRIDRLATQNEFIWRRALPPAVADEERGVTERFPIFDEESILFTTLSECFLRYLSPHPLLNRDKILFEWQRKYMAMFPHLKRASAHLYTWGSCYFQHLWFNTSQIHQKPPYSDLPTKQLFLDWESAKILTLLPDIQQDVLIGHLKSVIEEKIPYIPFDDSDFAASTSRIFRAVNQKKREELCSESKVECKMNSAR